MSLRPPPRDCVMPEGTTQPRLALHFWCNPDCQRPKDKAIARGDLPRSRFAAIRSSVSHRKYMRTTGGSATHCETFSWKKCFGAAIGAAGPLTRKRVLKVAGANLNR